MQLSPPHSAALMPRYQMLMIKYQLLAIRSQILFVLLGSPLFFYFDSIAFNENMPYGQWLDNYIMFWTYGWFFLFASSRLRRIMLLATILGLGLEIFASLIMGSYTYRLGNIPLYIPLGHAIIIASVYHIYNQTIISKNTVWLTQTLYPLSFVLSVLSLYFWNDMGGMILYVVFIVLLRKRKNKLPHLISFFFTYYLELFGTQMHAWEWYSTINNHPHWPNQANPPSGVGAAYLILNLLVLNSYILLRKYNQKKNIYTLRT